MRNRIRAPRSTPALSLSISAAFVTRLSAGSREGSSHSTDIDVNGSKVSVSARSTVCMMETMSW